MKSKIIIVSLLMSVAFFSCKDDKKKEEILPEQTEVLDTKELFNVDLEVVVKKDDDLQLYYKDESMKDYEEGKSVITTVKGSEIPQIVKFSLPKDVLPSEIRLDFGNNSSQDPIVVKDFKMYYYQKTFQAKDTLFYQYFQPNDQIDWNRKEAIAKPIVTENKVYDPLFLPRETLKLEIQKLIK